MCTIEDQINNNAYSKKVTNAVKSIKEQRDYKIRGFISYVPLIFIYTKYHKTNLNVR